MLKYKTEKDKKEAQRRWSLEYYHRNKEKVDDEQKRNYWIKRFRREGILK
jgi:hypothetical protein